MNINNKSNDKRLKIGFLSQFSPSDRKASSGTNYKMAEELSKIGDLKWIQIKNTSCGKKIGSIARWWNRHFTKHINIMGTFWGAKKLYNPISTDAMEDCDVIAAFFCMPILANLKIDKPIVYFSDATAQAMIDYYPNFSNLLSFNKNQILVLEKMAMDNASAIVLSSTWAANSASGEILKQSKEKVHIVEFGANIDERDIISTKRIITDTIEILFLGVDWERKGGDKAVEAVKWLNENGIKTNLHIVGINELPEKYQKIGFIKNYGFLNKNNTDDYNRLVDILSKMNCMLLPTKAECAGIAFAESSANGIPVFTHDTGGVSNYVYNGKNGYMLPLDSTGIDFGIKIKEVIESEELPKLSEGCRSIYKDKLNWTIWGSKVNDIIKDLL